MPKPPADPDCQEAMATRQLDNLATGEAVTVVLFRPELSSNGTEFECRFRLDGWPGTTPGRAYGVDAFQALDHAMKVIGVTLYASQLYKQGQLRWLDPNNGDLGFPVPRSVRDILPKDSMM